MNLPIYNCLIDDSPEDESGIYAMSFVEQPANETDFVALSKHPAKQYLNKNSSKQVLTGAVLRPDQLIYRNDPRMGEYYIRFSADQIEKISRKMMRTGIALQNTTHQHEAALSGNYLTELWIVENPEKDKSRALGFEALPKGTLMCSYKIEDKEYWESQVMTGNVKGFSLEGFFFQQKTNTPVKQTKNNQKQNRNMKKTNRKSQHLFSRLAEFFLDIEAVEKADATASGLACIIFTLTDGKEIKVDADGFATLDDEQCPAGEHPLANGNILVVDEQGQFVETKEPSEKSETPKQATAPQTMATAPVGKQPAADGQEDPSQPSAEGGDSVDALKAKIADLESKLSELAGLAKEANTEVQKLRRHTPSVLPVAARASSRKLSEMKRYEQMAQALSLSIRKRGTR